MISICRTVFPVISGMFMISSSLALSVVSPSEGMAVVAGTPFEVEWIGVGDQAWFDIDLHYCGSYSFCLDDDNCGFFLASLCPEGEDGCGDEDGGYEVVMPEPPVSGDGYRVRISQRGMDRVRCSEEFYLLDSATGATGPGPSITVLSPTSESIALAGDQYTVEWEYDNGFGSSVGRFKIDLYMSEGPGDCGTWQTSICDKPERGCKDTTGDYNVVIPDTTASGTYKIRVGLQGDDSVYACSQPFGVLSAWDFS